MSFVSINKKKALILIIIFFTNHLYPQQNIKALTGALKQNFFEDLTGSVRNATFFDFDTINSNGFVVGLILMTIGLIVKSHVGKSVEILKSHGDESIVKIKIFIKDKFNKTKDINKKITLAKEFGNDFLKIYNGNTGKAFIEITAMCNQYNIDINVLKAHVEEQVDKLSAIIKENYENIENKIAEKKNLKDTAEEKIKKAQRDKEINQLTKITKNAFDNLSKIEELQKTLNIGRKIRNIGKNDEKNKKKLNDSKIKAKKEDYSEENL